MKDDIKYDLLTNSEIKIKMIELENEYERYKNEMTEIAEKMDSLNESYIKLRGIYNKRNKYNRYE